MDAAAIIRAVQVVTRKWAKQRKAEEREGARALRRSMALISARRRTIKDVAFAVMEAAYLKASSSGRYPAHARQIMYAARGPIQDQTGRALDDQYFCQGLLPDYLNAFPEHTADWDVVFDSRGHFEEPHTGRVVPLGTLDVRSYLAQDDNDDGCEVLPTCLFPTHGPRHRFGAILFIEKEGFMPLFRAVRLADRYDLAIMSTKGMSVTASRKLVDRLCFEYDLPLLVLRDFDKAGFSIAGTLSRDTRRYEFTNRIRVLDLGLRLEDVRAWNLDSEQVFYGQSDPSWNLKDNGATPEEIAFLLDPVRSQGSQYVGRRVELNAFSSGDLVQWIEEKLQQHGVQKVVPDSETLATAYRRAVARTLRQRRLEEITRQTDAEAAELLVPATLGDHVQDVLRDNPTESWDAAVATIVLQEFRDA